MIDLNTLQSINNRIMTLLKCPDHLTAEIGLISVQRWNSYKIVIRTKTEFLHMRTSKKLDDIMISDDLFHESIFIIYRSHSINMMYIAEFELKIIKL